MMKKVNLFHKFLHQKMTILLHKIVHFQNFPFYYPSAICMIDHDFVSIQENDEKS